MQKNTRIAVLVVLGLCLSLVSCNWMEIAGDQDGGNPPIEKERAERIKQYEQEVIRVKETIIALKANIGEFDIELTDMWQSYNNLGYDFMDRIKKIKRLSKKRRTKRNRTEAKKLILELSANNYALSQARADIIWRAEEREVLKKKLKDVEKELGVLDNMTEMPKLPKPPSIGPETERAKRIRKLDEDIAHNKKIAEAKNRVEMLREDVMEYNNELDPMWKKYHNIDKHFTYQIKRLMKIFKRPRTRRNIFKIDRLTIDIRSDNLELMRARRYIAWCEIERHQVKKKLAQAEKELRSLEKMLADKKE